MPFSTETPPSQRSTVHSTSMSDTSQPNFKKEDPLEPWKRFMSNANRQRAAIPEGAEIVDLDSLPDAAAHGTPGARLPPITQKDYVRGPYRRYVAKPDRKRAHIPADAVIIDLDAEPVPLVKNSDNVTCRNYDIKQEDDEDGNEQQSALQQESSNRSSVQEALLEPNEAEPTGTSEQKDTQLDGAIPKLSMSLQATPKRRSDVEQEHLQHHELQARSTPGTTISAPKPLQDVYVVTPGSSQQPVSGSSIDHTDPHASQQSSHVVESSIVNQSGGGGESMESPPKPRSLATKSYRNAIQLAQMAAKARVYGRRPRPKQHENQGQTTRLDIRTSPVTAHVVNAFSDGQREEMSGNDNHKQEEVKKVSEGQSHSSQSGTYDNDGGLFVRDESRHDTEPDSMAAQEESRCNINAEDDLDDDAEEPENLADSGLDDQIKEAILEDKASWRAAKAAYIEMNRKRKRAEEPTIEEEIEWERARTNFEILRHRRRQTRMMEDSTTSDNIEQPDNDWQSRLKKRLQESHHYIEKDIPLPSESTSNVGPQIDISGDEEEATHFERLNVLSGGPAAVEVIKTSRRNKGTKSNRKNGGSKKRSKAKTESKTKTSNRILDPKAKAQKKSKLNKSSGHGHQMLNVPSLLSTDVIRDARGNIEGLPAFASTNRRDALQKLMKSLQPELRDDANADKKRILQAINNFVVPRSIKTIPGGNTASYGMPGMKSNLQPHQLLGAAFMRSRENDGLKPLGGICADQMGLGKTVMMLANIVDGKKKLDVNSKIPNEKKLVLEDEAVKTTLVVATNALVEQWNNEIPKHCVVGNKGLNVIVHKAGSRLQTSNDAAALMHYDIVLTTYNEVRRSHPKADYPLDLNTAEEKSKWWNTYFKENRGVLHEVRFLRIVLDEAQAIKNFRSHTSIACNSLRSKYRWALSGTPIQNSAQELYPYFKFLKVQGTGSYKVFCNNFIGSGSHVNVEGAQRLQQLLARIMIRRTHQSKVMGMPLVVLPKASAHIWWCKFNDLERSIYEIVHSRMVKRINNLSRCKQLERNYSHILTMLLRLRQLTGHLLTLQQPMQDLLEREDHEKIHDLALIERDEVKSELRRLQIRQIRALLAKGATGSSHSNTKFPGVNDFNKREETTGRSKLQDPDNVGQRHGLHYNFLRYLQTLREGDKMDELNERTTCVVCADKAEEPMTTSCYHIYCKTCLETAQTEAAEEGRDSRCKACGVEFTFTKACDDFDSNGMRNQDQAGDISSDTEDALRQDEKRRKRKKRKGEKEKKEDWIDQEGINILPSAKTIGIKAQVLNWIEEDPSVKIIIFTQFVDMIRILSKVCQGEKWGFTTYYGGKTMEQRLHSLKEFTDQPNVRILLASLKTGGIGLNLTMASKVIIVDPWWNSSVEQQAFCRVFRIGQSLETSLTRFVVENTVDQTMVEMQERKQAEIDHVMDGKATKLNTTELLSLFGCVREDDKGNPFVYTEEPACNLNPLADDDEGRDDEF